MQLNSFSEGAIVYNIYNNNLLFVMTWLLTCRDGLYGIFRVNMTLSKQFEKNKQTNQWLAIFLKYFGASSEYLSTYLPVDNNTLNIPLLISKQAF